MINHNAMRAFGHGFQLLCLIVAAIFEVTKMAASGPQRNRNRNKRAHCIVVDRDPLISVKILNFKTMKCAIVKC
jgi:hypothetical protein